MIRRIALVLVALIALGAMGSAVFMLRGRRTPPPGFVSIKTLGPYQDATLLKKANALPVAATFQMLLSQTNPSACGPASVANVYRSAGEMSTQEEIAKFGTGCVRGMCFGGLTLDQLADAAIASHHGWSISVMHPIDVDAFRKELRTYANDLDRRYIINFDRFPLFGTGGGHHSPIGGYLEEEDLVFVMDVNASYQPWLVKTDRLFEAMDTLDGTNKRGLILFTH
ncbi:MAG: phytochelatin synthase [Archangium sp.]|nr:phytochelatin synthase [Archangium sp.]